PDTSTDKPSDSQEGKGKNKKPSCKKKFDIERVIENAEIRKNNFSLLYTEQDKEFGRKLDKWKKYKYIQGQGKEKGKLLRYSIWHKDIFVQDRHKNEKEEEEEEGNVGGEGGGGGGEEEEQRKMSNSILMDLQLKNYLLKNKNTSEEEKNAIKNNHIDVLLKWEEERKKDLIKKLRKESQSLHAYLSRLHTRMNPAYIDLSCPNLAYLIGGYPSPSPSSSSSSSPPSSSSDSSSLTTTIPLKKDLSASKSTLNQHNLIYSNSILTLSNSSNKLNSINNLLSTASLAINTNNQSYKERYDTSKYNTLMRKTKSENKISYVRDYCKRKKKLSKQNEQYPKNIFSDNNSVMDRISNHNFSVDRFIHEYKAFVKHKESLWNRENNYSYRVQERHSRSYNGITIDVGTGSIINGGSSQGSIMSGGDGSTTSVSPYGDPDRRKSIIQILKEQSLELILDLVNSTVNSDEQYVRYKFKANYSGNPSPEYIHDMIHLLMHRTGEWSDKELLEIRTFISNLKAFKGRSKDFLTNILYNSKVNHYNKNTTINT
ncbi:hypothetical protein PIROE2DRAFT_9498, partial [Piromyces sp. E2]